MVGTCPKIWIVKEGEEVMLNPETTDPSRIDVLEQLTAEFRLSSAA